MLIAVAPKAFEPMLYRPALNMMYASITEPRKFPKYTMAQFLSNSDNFTLPPNTDSNIRQLPVNSSAPPRITSIKPTEKTVPIMIFDIPIPTY